MKKPNIKKPKMEKPKDVLISLCAVSFAAGAAGFMLSRFAPPLATILLTVSFIYAIRAFVFSVGGMHVKKTGIWKELKVSWPELAVVCAVSGGLAICGFIFLFLIAAGLR